MSISTRSPYPHAPYQQDDLSFRAFMEGTELDDIMTKMPVRQKYIKVDEVEKIADALLDKEINKQHTDNINVSNATGYQTPIMHEEVYNKPIANNLIDFNDPALKKLIGMLPIKGIEKKIVGDIERKSLQGDLGSHVKSTSFGDAEGYISNFHNNSYHFITEDGMISNLYFSEIPRGTQLLSSNEFDKLKIGLVARIYKVTRIAYESLLIGATDEAAKTWADISKSNIIAYKKSLTNQRAIADALRAQIQFIAKKYSMNLEQAFKKAYDITRISFPNNEDYFVVGRFLNAAAKEFVKPEFAEKIQKLFGEDFNTNVPAIVIQHVDEQDIYRLVQMFKKYIESLKITTI